jgi:predicted Fe-Mo cluster-binding NifX family protein
MYELELEKRKAEEIARIGMWFDVVYSVRAFHHFDDPARCLGGLKHVIGLNGRCLLVDYHEGAQTGIAERYYSLDEAAGLVESAGLTILERKRVDDYFLIAATLGKWKVAVAVDAGGETIFPGMFGQAPRFAIYSCSAGGRVKLDELRENPYEKTLQRGKTFDVYKLVDDCQAVVSARIGTKGIARLKKIGVKLFFETGGVRGALETLRGDLSI